MFKNYTLEVTYKKDGKPVTVSKSDDVLEIFANASEDRLDVSVKSRAETELVSAKAILPYSYRDDSRIFVNGYQSWSESREYLPCEKFKGLLGPSAIKAIRHISGISGDYHFKKYPSKKGVFHGYTLGYVRNGEICDFIGSLNERTGYTILDFNVPASRITVEKELENVKILGNYQLFSLVGVSDIYDVCFDTYFDALDIQKPRLKRLCGYTSWYNYYNRINEKIILRDLENLYKVAGDKAEIFQIDDGYQTAVGDWLSVDSVKFPSGMKYVADKIHEKGYLAGIWLAPFNCQRNSVVAKEHPDWLVKDKNGKPRLGCVGWGGAYTLDIYNPECRDYIRNFFNVILGEWGFDMVKLDFLYSACIVARNGKSRGQLMCEAVDFLRECVGEKYILGCGVPLGPAFGKFDFCRIGSDAEITFKERFYTKITNREIISTKTAIKNTLFRRGLNGRAFVNDPDVFFLRNYKVSKDSGAPEKPLGYSEKQKELLADVCSLCGGILFTSDNVGEYDEKHKAMLLKTYAPPAEKVNLVSWEGNDVIKVYTESGGKKSVWTINSATGENDKN